MIAAAGALVAILVLAVTAPGAGATLRPIDSHCSPSGDFCQGIFRKDERIKFDMAQFPFRGKYQLCVKPPRQKRSCGKFKWHRKTGSLFRSRVDFARNFPSKGRGLYRVTWRVDGTKVGKTLRFRKR